MIVGDTISFAGTIETKGISESRPEWGIVQIRNSGTNQHGEAVFSFLGIAFVPLRNKSA